MRPRRYNLRMSSKFDPQNPLDETRGKHHRRSVRYNGYDYSQAGAYFVTVVTHQRACLFGEVVDGEMVSNDFGKIVDECWRAIPEHFPNVVLGAYVVMPNHVHGIIVIRDDDSHPVVGAQHCCAPTQNPHKINVKPGSLGAIMRSCNSAVPYRINKEHNATGIWQRNYYDRIIRNEREMDAIWRYIESHPAHWNDDEENPRHQ